MLLSALAESSLLVRVFCLRCGATKCLRPAEIMARQGDCELAALNPSCRRCWPHYGENMTLAIPVRDPGKVYWLPREGATGADLVAGFFHASRAKAKRRRR